ncbi:hypothetical protein SAMN06295926_11526 [Lysinibacillus sp. AC-3]|nr:hypothetical protein SAMN06295926_11526 [Lysinibacillus sp. AC-3]
MSIFVKINLGLRQLIFTLEFYLVMVKKIAVDPLDIRLIS